MEQALGIVLACITELGRSIEEARGASNADHIVEGIQSILSVKRTTTLHGLDIGGGDGVDTALGVRSHNGGTRGQVHSSWHQKLVKMRQTCETWSCLCRPRLVIRLGLGPVHSGMMISAVSIASYRLASPRKHPLPLSTIYDIPCPPENSFSPRGRSIQSPSLPSRDFSSNKPSTSIVQRSLPEPPLTPQPVYLHYLHETAGPGWDVALAVTSLSEDIPAVPLALTAPLTQVLDVVSGIRVAVKTMRDGKDECTHLLFRVLKFLHSLVDGLKGRNIPDSTPTASSLFALKSNLMAISADATRWSRLRLVTRYIRRIKL
ncbi:hypothetical protein BS47DRAFT_178076 [Hydnum rufescens UP504]|uniref:Uncharacterized protein n=1 Tax=Hydnum rufescens UP504 TaxID=1448309 RepID=A0A9P6ANS9_9AGAM|nr:hypothetical protein BS47DRAFT_178076 [Hydnum rufescens UP504]